MSARLVEYVRPTISAESKISYVRLDVAPFGCSRAENVLAFARAESVSQPSMATDSARGNSFRKRSDGGQMLDSLTYKS